MTEGDLLSLLADGDFHSGEALGRELGISRTAVWKQLQKLGDRGVEVETVRGRGYRLTRPLELLDPALLESELAALGCGGRYHIDVRDAVDSTNAVVTTLAAGAGLVPVSTAERQTAGRGRRGKPWVSPYASNLYFSLLWQFEGGAAALEGLSLAVGVGLARVVSALDAPDVALKWPNDVHYRGKKLAGILLELQGDPDGRCGVVIGVGVNVSMPGAAAAAIDQEWTDLTTIALQLPGRNALLARVLAELHAVISGFEREGFAVFRDEWQALDAYADSKVCLRSGDTAIEGVARGVSERGALLLERDGRLEPFSGGELSLRPR